MSETYTVSYRIHKGAKVQQERNAPWGRVQEIFALFQGNPQHRWLYLETEDPTKDFKGKG